MVIGQQIQYDRDFPDYSEPQAFVQKCDPPKWWVKDQQYYSRQPGYESNSPLGAEDPNGQTSPDGEPFDYCKIPKQRPKVDCKAYEQEQESPVPKNPEADPPHLYEDCPELRQKANPYPMKKGPVRIVKLTCSEWREYMRPTPKNKPYVGKVVRPKGCHLKK
ncbi:MAG TPA: hypothetical protein VLF21_00745 [Candidatus Saccharimonadales bacterium]|nr:hypothetical protein [Candidatus Saccharimonadales bacterium]